MKTIANIRMVISCALLIWLGSLNAGPAVAQTTVGFHPNISGESVKLVYKHRSVQVDMEQEAEPTLPGDTPHRYKVLFTAVKDKHVYLLVRICSASPISNPYAPCGGDQPCALLWIKADESLVQREIKSEIFDSCSYNYSQVGKTTLASSKLTIVYTEPGGPRTELTYDNTHPERGIMKRQL